MRRGTMGWLSAAASLGFAAAMVCMGVSPVRGDEDAKTARFDDALEDHGDKQPQKEAADRVARRNDKPRVNLRLYEWGVQRSHWDGSAVTPNDIPAFYYDSAKIPLGPSHERPMPPDPASGGPVIEPECIDPEEECVDKPVIYFESDEDLNFYFEVKALAGRMTWVYPKPDRRVDEATVQWDDIKLYSDMVRRRSIDPKTLPVPRELARDHWARYSRDGGLSTLVTNGEAERFLFYECTNRDLPECDVYRNDKGEIFIRNYGCCPLHDVRLRLPLNDKSSVWRAWYVREIPAASGDTPHEIKLVDGSLVELAATRKPGVLEAETTAAGLTAAQARVFERCWREDFLLAEQGVLTFRRDQKYLDELAKFTLPAHIKWESKRVGYMWMGRIDLSRQSEMDKLASAAAEGDMEAQSKLGNFGPAGIGAVRRLLSSRDLPLKKRMALASWLKSKTEKK